jgi:hypothetical protein
VVRFQRGDIPGVLRVQLGGVSGVAVLLRGDRRLGEWQGYMYVVWAGRAGRLAALDLALGAELDLAE